MRVDVSRRYIDPCELIWLATARRVGLVVRRTEAVYASTDGRGLLWLGATSTLDADDCLAQMVFHELCHWLVNGPASRYEPDWGFAPMEQVDWREFATLRVQRALAGQHGLGAVLASTTDARPYYDELVDPRAPNDDSPREATITARAREALDAYPNTTLFMPLETALSATAALRQTALPFAEREHLWAR